eukprot:2408057-Pyramimonas_sp.AAC.1
MHNVSEQLLSSFLEKTRHWADLSTSRAMLASRSSFMKWVQEMWSTGPGAVHRHVKQPQALEWEAMDSAGNMTIDKHTLLSAESCRQSC